MIHDRQGAWGQDFKDDLGVTDRQWNTLTNAQRARVLALCDEEAKQAGIAADKAVRVRARNAETLVAIAERLRSRAARMRFRVYRLMK